MEGYRDISLQVVALVPQTWTILQQNLGRAAESCKAYHAQGQIETRNKGNYVEALISLTYAAMVS